MARTAPTTPTRTWTSPTRAARLRAATARPCEPEGTERLSVRGGEPQREGHDDVVAHLVGRFPVALADAVIETPDRRLAAHVADRGALLGRGTEREGDAQVVRLVANGELADGLVACLGADDLRGAETRLGEFLHREQVVAAQRVVALLVAAVERVHLDADLQAARREVVGREIHRDREAPESAAVFRAGLSEVELQS